MKKMRYRIEFVECWDTKEIVELYKAGGWWKDSFDSSGVPALISNSFVFAVVVDDVSGKAIGMGRVISDGVSDAYIQDVVVLEAYRNKGIGAELVSVLISQCQNHNICWIGVIAQPGSLSLYKRLGFTPMKDHVALLFEGGDK